MLLYNRFIIVEKRFYPSCGNCGYETTDKCAFHDSCGHNAHGFAVCNPFGICPKSYERETGINPDNLDADGICPACRISKDMEGSSSAAAHNVFFDIQKPVAADEEASMSLEIRHAGQIPNPVLMSNFSGTLLPVTVTTSVIDTSDDMETDLSVADVVTVTGIKVPEKLASIGFTEKSLEDIFQKQYSKSLTLKDGFANGRMGLMIPFVHLTTVYDSKVITFFRSIDNPPAQNRAWAVQHTAIKYKNGAIELDIEKGLVFK